MLVQLLPEQISQYWDLIRYSIENSFPPTVREIDTNAILQNLLTSNMQAWVSVDKSSKKIVAVITTAMMLDIGAKRPDLLIYSLFGVSDQVGRENWLEGFETIKKYASAQGCGRVTAFTAFEAIKKLAQWFGGKTEFTYITIDL